MRNLSLIFMMLCFSYLARSQKTKQNDTLFSKTLDSVVLVGYKIHNILYLTDVSGVNIYSGKKTNLVFFNPTIGSYAQNNARTAYAQIPGLTMWEMDGAGLQINIGSRGTDSHRSIEMNMRQNGYNTNSDMFGYPEDHYTPPLQGVERVELVRGSAALQFGSQFGGMMNYVMKSADSSKPFSIEGEETIGSNNLVNSFTSVSGAKGKWGYYIYYDNRHGNGYRQNANFNYNAYYGNLTYQFNPNNIISLQYSGMDYVDKIAGPLTDLQFQQNSKQSLRSRNYFNPEINIPAVIFKSRFSANTRFELASKYLYGQRNSVQFLANALVADTINTTINSYNPRQVDRDYYSGFASEARVLHSFKIGNLKNTMSAGLRYSVDRTSRKQKGIGTANSDFDLSLTKPYGIVLKLNTTNYAIFAENIMYVSKRLTVTPGFRIEYIKTGLNGKINNATTDENYNSKRSFPLFGAGLQYQVSQGTQVYANISQAYRPFLYANITPADRVDVIDPNLKDSKGYDIDFGYRGRIKNILNFDVNAFYLFYGNRVGLLTQKKLDGTTNLYTTNVGNALITGVEVFGQLSILNPGVEISKTHLSVFNSMAIYHGRYLSTQLNASGVNVNIKGNHIENVPDITTKTGLIFSYKKLNSTVQFSYTDLTYNDALNSKSSANGITGIIPEYQIWDWHINLQINQIIRLSSGINNFTDKKYFNRRITIYPGPGILPADGRTFYFSIGFVI